MRKRDIRRVTAILVGLGAAGIAIGWVGEEMAGRYQPAAEVINRIAGG